MHPVQRLQLESTRPTGLPLAPAVPHQCPAPCTSAGLHLWRREGNGLGGSTGLRSRRAGFCSWLHHQPPQPWPCALVFPSLKGSDGPALCYSGWPLGFKTCCRHHSGRAKLSGKCPRGTWLQDPAAPAHLALLVPLGSPSPGGHPEGGPGSGVGFAQSAARQRLSP